eukprot:GILI01034078.1.p1 GENE.GILI01034078.1~~GILI01034078.1.p1  ORF type:complete len:179 (+),score=55.88 GILI01034078.1:312-848(+)
MDAALDSLAKASVAPDSPSFNKSPENSVTLPEMALTTPASSTPRSPRGGGGEKKAINTGARQAPSLPLTQSAPFAASVTSPPKEQGKKEQEGPKKEPEGQPNGVSLPSNDSTTAGFITTPTTAPVSSTPSAPVTPVPAEVPTDVSQSATFSQFQTLHQDVHDLHLLIERALAGDIADM